MEKGFNSDVMYRGLQFHVQTEDWGRENPYLVSRVYQNGAVIKSMKTAYSEVLVRSQIRDQVRDPNGLRAAVAAAMRDQHQGLIESLVAGQLL